MELGNCDVCFNVKDVKASLEFYKKLGLEVKADNSERGYAYLKYRNLTLGLFQGHFHDNMLNFRGGDVFAIAKMLKERGLSMQQDAVVEGDRSAGATIADPDGNLIYFNTGPGEAIV